MSTLKVNNLQDINGANNSTPEQVAQGRAKAWVNFNGTGTVAIRDDFNVSSITDNGTGNYTITFDNAMPSANYAITGSQKEFDATTNSSTQLMIGKQLTLANSITTTFVRVVAAYAGNNYDSVMVSVVIFGDQ